MPTAAWLRLLSNADGVPSDAKSDASTTSCVSVATGCSVTRISSVVGSLIGSSFGCSCGGSTTASGSSFVICTWCTASARRSGGSSTNSSRPAARCRPTDSASHGACFRRSAISSWNDCSARAWGNGATSVRTGGCSNGVMFASFRLGLTIPTPCARREFSRAVQVRDERAGVHKTPCTQARPANENAAALGCGVSSQQWSPPRRRRSGACCATSLWLVPALWRPGEA